MSDTFGIVIGIIAILAGILIYFAMRRKEALIAYQTSLRQLKANPSNPDLRQQTLSLGRTYLNLSHDKEGVFNEVALKNELDAACAASGHAQARSIEERLAKLQQLLTAGHIDEQEYGRRRQGIIDEV